MGSLAALSPNTRRPSIQRGVSEEKSRQKHPKLQRAWRTFEEECTAWVESCKQTIIISATSLSDGTDDVALQTNTFKSASFRRKFSEKSVVKPVSNSQQQLTSIYEEYHKAMIEYSKLKQLIDQVHSEYEETKDFEIFKRYSMLKGVIKRCLTYMKLGILPDAPGAAAGLCSITDASAPSSNTHRYSLSTTADLSKTELAERTEATKRRISFLRSQIQSMSDKYETSKQYMVFQRYRLMKAMVKELVADGSRY